MNRLILIAVCLFFASSLSAQQENKILGTWLTQHKNGKVTITRDAKGIYSGVITWLLDPIKNNKPLADEKNPDSKLQGRALMKLKVLSGFTYNKSDNHWVNGTIYDPKNGKTYSCKINELGDKLDVRGYVGFSLMG